MTRKVTKALELEQIFYAWRILLHSFSVTGELLKAFKQALNVDEIPERLKDIDKAIKNKNWHLLPSIIPLSSKEIGTARAAWSDTENQIYINKDWVKTAGKNEINSVLTEEFGHFLDNLVNSNDTIGDEGYVFSQILFSDSNSLDGNGIFSYQNDHIIISLNSGKKISAESSNFTGGGGDDTISGTSGADNIDGREGNDSINGGEGGDTIDGGEGDDTIDGGQGNDVAIYNGNFANYTVTEISYGTYSVTDNVGNDGIDTIINVEKFQFNDQNYSINRFIADENGDGLVDGAPNYYIFTNSLPIALKTSSGKQLSDSTDSSWNVVNAVQNESGFKILLKGSANRQGKYQIRDVNAQGLITVYSGWKTTNDALQLEWESIFGDFNNDGIIGFPIADANSDGLVDGANIYQIFNNGTPITLKSSQNSTFSDSTNPNWNAIKAVSSGLNYKILIKGLENKHNNYQIWDVNSNGMVTGKSGWKSTNHALQLDWESTFGDFNDDGIIGFPILDSNSDGLVDGAISYQFYNSGSSIALTTPQGKQISDLSSPDWNITKVVADGSDWKVLFKGENEFDGLYKAWTANASGQLLRGIFWSEWKSSRWILENGYSEIFNLGLPPTELIELSKIQGVSDGDYFGGKISLSSDGNRMAVSSRFSGNNGERSGQVSIYSWDDPSSNWQLLGSPIVGESAGHQAGYTNAISADGNRIAISSPFNNLTSSSSSFRRGQIRTYEWNGSSWIKSGEIYGQKKDDRAGYSLEYAANGNVLAIGATNNDNSKGRDAGNVRIFRWANNSWQQMGTDINGEAAGDNSGAAISLSKDGLTVAIGAYLNDGKGYSNAQPGHVRVYKFDGSSWIQTGQDIDGEKYSDFSGSFVDLSSDGQLLAISALINDGNGQNSGHVRVYQWDASSNSWIQHGSDIDGSGVDDYFGYSPKFLDDGNKIIVGSANSSVPNSPGAVRIYEWNGVDWSQLLGNIVGVNTGDRFGRSLDVTNDGKRISIGAPGNDIGYVKTFRLLPTYSTEVKDVNNDGLRDGLITKYQVVNGSTAIDIKNSHGKILSESTSPSWDIIKSVISGSGYKILLKGTGTYHDKYQIWDLDSNGNAHSYSGWKSTSHALQLDWESTFGDFNGDGIVGFPIADDNGDGLVDGANNYQIFNNGSAITITNQKGKTLSDSTNPNWNAIKAVSSDSGYKILLQGSGNKDDKYQIRETNLNGLTTNYSKWETTNDALQLGWESIFGDFNGDGIVGFPIADDNGDGLVDGANNYQIFNNGSAITITNQKGKTLSDSTNPNWNAIKAVSSDSGYKILLQGSGNKDDKYQIRETNLNGLTTNYSKWETTNDALQLGWESIFGDINGDGLIGLNP